MAPTNVAPVSSSLSGALDGNTELQPALFRPNDQHRQNMALTDQELLSQDFQRTVTIVFWFKSLTDPIRLPLLVPTFPYFQLSRFPSLCSDLGLTAQSYLDTFNPLSGQWDQHTISSIRVISSNQRLLYRVRRTLLEGLKDHECIGLQEEIESQPNNLPSRPKKRPASDPPEQPAPPVKQHITPNHFVPPKPSPIARNISLPMSPSLSQATVSPISPSAIQPVPSVTSPSPSKRYPHHHPPPYEASTSSRTATTTGYIVDPKPVPPTSSPSISFHPHPPMKRFPNDYTVAQIAKGFYAMDTLISITSLPSSSTTDNAKAVTPITQKTAFEKVFGTRYVKSTVCRHRALYRKAPHTIREQYEGYSDEDERGIWGDFVKSVEGKTTKSTKPGAAQSSGGGGGDGPGMDSL